MSAVRDPYLDVPLDGVRLIEASAGTGKTYTLATLVTRLVVERGLRVGQILAVTFTDAATQELRKRIRERLQLTLALADAPAAGGTSADAASAVASPDHEAGAHDAAVEDTGGDDPTAEAALTRQLLQAHRARGEESGDALRRRLRQATLDIDLAAIFTIHGFCARVLREHALESGHGFDAPDLLPNDRDLRAELAADLWRRHAQDATTADDLGALWPHHDALADDLRLLLREPVLLPADAPLPPDPRASLLAAGAALAQAYRQHGDTCLAGLVAALEAKVLNGNSYRRDWIEALWQQWSAWCDGGDFTAPLDARIARLTDEALQGKVNKGKQALLPRSPMGAEIAAYVSAAQAQAEYVARRRIALLHRLRSDARTRLAILKRQRRVQTYDDLVDGVADALDGAHGAELAAQLRAQYRVALVDEFQDTDARQWAIFNRVFGEGSPDPALFLIGDPKQAIYGFRGGDVHTYLDAGTHASAAPPLSQNFRSRPAVLQAIAALYAQAGEDAFIDPRIGFRAVDAGGKRTDHDYLRDGVPAAALTVWRAPPPPPDAAGKRKPWRAGDARALATRACVAAIHGVLSQARRGDALVAGTPVQPGDIAVLVRSHHEATLVQQALALAGIAAVAAGRQSLFATHEARELHALLLALLHAGDDGRLRAALSTVLLGVDAAGIEALEAPADEAGAQALRDRQQEAMGWRERLLRGGPLALVGDLCAANAERLLGLLDGERRMSNFLQLAELLQEAQANALGLHGLVDWLGHRIATADANDETQLLRLESDARRVQIVTLHKSKGLEYPLVFLPFVGIGRQDKAPGRACVVHDAQDGRRLHWKLGDDTDWAATTSAWKQDQRAEDARLLYVGLTRAEHALWIATGAFFAYEKTPLSMMLRDTAALAAAGVAFDDHPAPDALPRLPAEHDAAIPPARRVTRRLSHDWWVYSFSQLAKADAGTDADTASSATVPASGGNDEPDSADDAAIEADIDPRFTGNRYGVALHAALEHADFGAWRDWQTGDAAAADERAVIADALRDEGYAADVLDDGIALTTQLVGQTLTAALPEGVRLCDVPASERRPEIEFQFALRTTQVDALLRLLHAHGVVRERHGFGLRQALEGLMTGLVDLTYRHAGKWYVLDYKSNRLPAYDDAAMAQAMAHSEYDLQALIYTLALHRWLRFRLRGDYDYARDFGGIRYVFCRGLDARLGDTPAAYRPGIHAQRFDPALVDALDALFGQGEAEGIAA